ncbi:alpha/beta fold hydrolase [Paenibacillus hexagrammi]|uniref:Alpha/beta hydrolase n=1 Tax=Paenibacillus hexagrammi TaxID=2908839 RepID=A0ABY3SHL7_9BACL|nr:alpha/beta hydrolase [Paenibacillus sp. YPD9-1]UJF32983.1 alpha/beta hydrolase [Paenibacillus sp. YPD9-1]
MGYYIEVERGVNLFVEDIGKGRPVVFLHGWPVNHRMFEYQTSQLPKFGFRCILIDLRGFGQSDKPWHGYTYDALSDDIRFILDALQLHNVKLVGFSMGGAIAVRYMSRHSGHRVSQLVLLGAAAPSFVQRRHFPYGQKAEDVTLLIEQTMEDRPRMLSDFGSKFFASQPSNPFMEWFQSLGLTASARSTAATAASLRDEDLRTDLAKVQVPTTIFHGALDQICPFDLAIKMHEGIKDSALLRFEQSGHGLFYDERSKFNQHLLLALQGVRFRIGVSP